MSADPRDVIEPEPAPPAPGTREAAIAEMAANEGVLWATSWFEALKRDGRRVAGGWPGTLSEARARITATSRALRLNAGELQMAAKVAYVSARKAWAAYAEPDDESDDRD